MVNSYDILGRIALLYIHIFMIPLSRFLSAFSACLLYRLSEFLIFQIFEDKLAEESHGLVVDI